MGDDEIRSRAFRGAALKSESYRTVGVLVLLSGLLVYAVARGIVAGQFRLLVLAILFTLVAIAYEWYMLNRINAAIRLDRRIPEVVWLANVLIETQIPTLALFLLIRSHLVSPYVALVAPAVFFYFYFIILSILRLSPLYSVTTGISAGIGYAIVTAYAFSDETAA